MTQVLGNDKQGLVFEITSARIYDGGEDRKHVIYTLQVRYISGSDDLSPSVIERRYTHFLNLYNALKKEQPQLMNCITFPKKVLVGNFDSEVISTRSTGFESLLTHISTESKLRGSLALADFLQAEELTRLKSLLEQKDYALAMPLFENSFKLLNKVFTDRSPAVLLSLCRLLACCMNVPGYPDALKWAELALRRYDGVSDSDLLELYVPLLYNCIKVYEQAGLDTSELQQRLTGLRRQGIAVDASKSLLDQVNSVEEKLLNLA